MEKFLYNNILIRKYEHMKIEMKWKIKVLIYHTGSARYKQLGSLGVLGKYTILIILDFICIKEMKLGTYSKIFVGDFFVVKVHHFESSFRR